MTKKEYDIKGLDMKSTVWESRLPYAEYCETEEV
jgi:hypothetical protein